MGLGRDQGQHSGGNPPGKPPAFYFVWESSITLLRLTDLNHKYTFFSGKSNLFYILIFMAKKNNIFDQIFNRLLGLGIQSQKDLAGILGISSTSIWNAKKENRFPKKWVSILSRIYNKSPEWILGKQEVPPIQIETGLIKSLIGDVVELKNQINYLEGTVSLLREEIDAIKAKKHNSPTKKVKKNSQNYSDQSQGKEETHFVINS